MRRMDSRIRNKRADQDEGVRELTQVSHRRKTDWPFKYSVLDRGIVVNKSAPRKKGEVKNLGEALW